MIPFKIKDWLKNNPMDAECREDLANWCYVEFDIDDIQLQNYIWFYLRDISDLPK